MNKLFKKYQQFLGIVILLWLFIEITGRFGLDFRVDRFLFSQITRFFVLVFILGEIKVHWVFIFHLVKSFFLEKKQEVTRTVNETQSDLVKSQPKLSQNKLVFRITVWPVTLYSLVMVLTRSIVGFCKNYLFSIEVILIFLILGILTDIFIFSSSSDLLIITLTGLWIWVIGRTKFEGAISIVIALFFLGLCPFLLILKKDVISEKAAVWAYMFLVVGTTQILVENLRGKENRDEGEN